MKLLNQLQVNDVYAALSAYPSIFLNSTLAVYLSKDECNHSCESIPRLSENGHFDWDTLKEWRFTFTLLCLAAEGEEVADIVAEEE